MERQRVTVAIAVLLCVARLALAEDPNDPVLRVGPGVTTPKLLRKVDPTYSREGEAEKIQGTVLYSIVVGKTARRATLRF
jgi:hypothetical protein